MWPIVVSSICELIESRLHRHGRELVRLLREAAPTADGVQEAIHRARQTTIRAVAPNLQREVLDEADRLVRERLTGEQ